MNNNRLRKTLKIIFLVIFSLCFVILGVVLSVLKMYNDSLPSVAKLETYTPNLITKIYDVNDELLYEFFVERRIMVPLDSIPDALIEATLSIEDKNFYKHKGISIPDILRALWVDIKKGSIKQGGSTITQQLARNIPNLYLTREETISRKIKEMMLAYKIEKFYSKDKILELYLNQIPYGHGAHGAEAASRMFFGKSITQATTEECAMLSGLPNGPALYSPFNHPDRAIRRRNLVLKLMTENGYISSAEYDTLSQVEINLKSRELRDNDAPYFVEYIRQQLEDRFGSQNLYQNGYKVYTSLDLNLQKIANEKLEKRLSRLERDLHFKIVKSDSDNDGGEIIRNDYIQGALVLIDNETGYIKAMVGGRDFEQSKWNRAIQAKRQPGSGFKPFVYTAAIDNGITPSDIILDTPIVIEEKGMPEPYAPENYDKTFRGPTPLRKGLALSRNIISVKLLQKVGVYTVIDYAKRMGIESELMPVISLALGSSDVTLLELTSAYTTFANIGQHVNPISIIRIEDNQGNILENNQTYKEQVISPQTAYIMVDIMRSVMDYGTGAGARTYGFNRPAGGKTGTSNDYTNAWFVGYTPQLTCGVWVGFDQVKRIGRGMAGGVIALPIWADFMVEATKDMPEEDFEMPDGIVTREICTDTGLLATEFCPEKLVEKYIAGTEPTTECYLHHAVRITPDYNQGQNIFELEDKQSIKDYQRDF